MKWMPREIDQGYGLFKLGRAFVIVTRMNRETHGDQREFTGAFSLVGQITAGFWQTVSLAPGGASLFCKGG